MVYKKGEDDDLYSQDDSDLDDELLSKGYDNLNRLEAVSSLVQQEAAINTQ